MTCPVFVSTVGVATMLHVCWQSTKLLLGVALSFASFLFHHFLHTKAEEWRKNREGLGNVNKIR